MSQTRERVTVEVTHTWVPVRGVKPRLCSGRRGCGHEHPVWQEYYATGEPTRMAPQWTWCVDAACDCRTLRTLP